MFGIDGARAGDEGAVKPVGGDVLRRADTVSTGADAVFIQAGIDFAHARIHHREDFLRTAVAADGGGEQGKRGDGQERHVPGGGKTGGDRRADAQAGKGAGPGAQDDALDGGFFQAVFLQEFVDKRQQLARVLLGFDFVGLAGRATVLHGDGAGGAGGVKGEQGAVSGRQVHAVFRCCFRGKRRSGR